MQCAKFERRLQQLLDERKIVEQDELLRAHAQGCDTCGSVLRTQGLLLAGLRSFPESGVSHDLGPRVLDRLRLDRQKRTNRRFVTAALAAAAAILVILLPLARGPARFRPQVEPGSGALAIATANPHRPPSGKLTAQQSAELRFVMHQLMLQLTDHRLAMFEPVDQLASGIRPLAATFSFALDTLRRTLPGYSHPQPAEPQAVYQSSPAALG